MARREREPERNEKRNESPWVTVARYSEIGFMIPAAVIVGYLMGLAGDHFLHTHWLYLFGIVFGAVAGFVSMIRQALASSKETDEEVRQAERQNGGEESGKRQDGDGAGPHA